MLGRVRAGMTVFFVGVFVGLVALATVQAYIRWTVVILLLVLLVVIWTVPELLTGGKRRMIKRLRAGTRKKA